MNHNDILRSVRYMLDLSDSQLIKIIQMADESCLINKEDLQSYLKKDDEAGYVPCPEALMAAFLDGLIYHKRGKTDAHQNTASTLPIDNNVVLKKLRVAFELKDEDLHKIMQDAGAASASKNEISALFRKPGHHNYRACGDQWLRNFLKGLTLRIRVTK